MIRDFPLRHKAHITAVLMGWETDVGETHVSGVVSSQNDARPLWHASPTLSDELQALDKEDGAHQFDYGEIHRTLEYDFYPTIFRTPQRGNKYRYLTPEQTGCYRLLIMHKSEYVPQLSGSACTAYLVSAC